MKKWELVEENKPYLKQIFYPIMGVRKEFYVKCDVYRKKKWNGMFKYKVQERM